MVNVRYNDGHGFWCTARNVTNTSDAFVLLRWGDSARQPSASPYFIIQNIQNVNASERPCKQAMLFVNNAGGLHRVRSGFKTKEWCFDLGKTD